MLSRALDLVLAALALLGPFAIHLFFPVIPVIKVDFQLTDALAQLAFSIGVFGMAFSTLAYGAFADRYGRRPVLLIGLSLFLLGSMISALACSFIILLIGRLVQSIGAGCGITLARAIARDVYGAERLIKAIAYLTMFFAIGGLLAPGVGGVLVDQFGWGSIFAFPGPTALAARPFLSVPPASPTLMKELLPRPATEFGLYFAMVPLGFIIGTVISS